MILEHAAIWTRDLERLRQYYTTFFEGVAGEKYRNETRGFESYFIQFASGARLEIMYQPDIAEKSLHSSGENHLGLIHLAFGVSDRADVDKKAAELAAAGYPILKGPRVTGDGYYEFETLDPDHNRLEVTSKA